MDELTGASPGDWACLRPWAGSRPPRPGEYPAIEAAASYSRRVIGEIVNRLADLGRNNLPVRSVAVSGSLGRLEAGPHSDLDLILVLEDACMEESAKTEALQAVQKAVSGVGLAAPDPHGIFSLPTTSAELLDPRSLGRVVEERSVFGKRIQLLLDAQPVYGWAEHGVLVQAILQRYATGFLERDPRKEWVYLLNDLIRYFRSVAVETQWDFSRRGGGWFVRSLKLRNSRVLLFAGLLFLLGECSRRSSGKVEWLCRRVCLTPLERVGLVYEAHGDNRFAEVLRAYDQFVSAMTDPIVRAELSGPCPSDESRPWDSVPPTYGRLHESSRHMIAELVRFVMARKDGWSGPFFEYLLF